MGLISKLSKKCRKCSRAKDCNNKRIEACTFIEMPEKASINHVAPVTSYLMAPVVRVRNSVAVKMGDYSTINTNSKEIREKIEKQFYGNTFNMKCGFDKS
jgi:hypothetical protein